MTSTDVRRGVFWLLPYFRALYFEELVLTISDVFGYIGHTFSLKGQTGCRKTSETRHILITFPAILLTLLQWI